MKTDPEAKGPRDSENLIAEKKSHPASSKSRDRAAWQNANRPGSHGLTIMRERAEAVGGNLKVSSTPGQGTQVEASFPFQGNILKEREQ